jgi:hypothetical protein
MRSSSSCRKSTIFTKESDEAEPAILPCGNEEIRKKDEDIKIMSAVYNRRAFKYILNPYIAGMASKRLKKAR